MGQQEIINTISLTCVEHFHLAGILELYRRAGSATELMAHHQDIREIVPDASPKLVESFKDVSEAQRRAEKEYQWDEAHNIKTLCLNDDDYPQRMRECVDAPLLLYYLGSADLNAVKVISIVGTRHCTSYGSDIIRHFIDDLHQLCPSVLVVSGLAYGVDISAHRNCLSNGMNTVGVLAHGLDDLYPQSHRHDAELMIHQGGLATEFMTHTNADKMNFVRRNRIIAGLSDATILIESAAKGGGLITCGIAQSYGRDVFAFPGPVDAEYSRGCNNLIRDNAAGLISNAEDFVNAMQWQEDKQLEQARNKGIERTLFPDLSPEEQQVVNVLSKTNDVQINILSVKSNLPIAHLTSILFSLEMKGVVKAMAGGTYHLLK